MRGGLGLAIVGLALVLRCWGITYPDQYWDEQLHGLDAYAYLGATPELGWGDEPVKIQHEFRWEIPPLSKIFIAAGIGPLGYGPPGLRIAPVLAGTATVALLYGLALVVTRSGVGAGLAAFLLAVDGLHITLSRIATPDVFLVMFVVAAALFVARDHRVLDEGAGGSPRDRRWAGVMFGCAIACKWGALAPLAGAALLTGCRLGRNGYLRDLRQGARLALCFVVLPATVYVASYAQFWVQHGPAADDWVELQRRMSLRLRHGDDESPAVPTDYQPYPGTSRPATWPLLMTPTVIYEAPGRTIVQLGNPALWWAHLLAAPALAAMLLRRRDWRIGMVVGGYLVQYLPWFLFGRQMYLYYMAPVLPFLCLGVAVAVLAIPSRPWRRTAATGIVGIVAVTAAAFLPLWIGAPRPPWADSLQWLPDWEWPSATEGATGSG